MNQRMTHQAICSAGQRAVASRFRNLTTGAAACVILASACLSDVELPPCVVSGTCGEAGEGGSAQGGTSSSQAGAATPGGESGVGTGGVEAGASGVDYAGESGVGEGGCGTCSILPTQLPAGCQGQPYRTELRFEGGTAPYQWQLTPPAAGWSIGSADAQGVATLSTELALPSTTTLTVTGTDAVGRTKVATLSLRARTSCWFAYTALESGQGALHVVDPVDGRSIEPQHNQAVYDFRFSPDGKHIAYSYDASAAQPQGRKLALIDVESQTEQALALQADAIRSFAWSPDSTALAVGFEAQGVTKLGAIRLPADGANASPASFTPINARVERDLSWVGNRFVAYHAEAYLDELGVPLPNPELLRTAFYAELQGTEFAPEVFTRGQYERRVSLRSLADGFFMLSSHVPPTTFYRLVGDPIPPRGQGKIALLSPSGKYTAFLPDNGLLSFTNADQGLSGVPAATAKSGETCQLVLAWAQNKERVACVVDVLNPDNTYHGEVRFFDLPAQGTKLQMIPLTGHCEDDTTITNGPSCTRDDDKYGYGVEQARNTARAFSPSGSWFAFTRVTDKDGAAQGAPTNGDVYVYLGAVNGQTAALSRRHVIARDGNRNRPTSLAFSPDERLLFVQRGHTLTMLEVGGMRLSWLVAGDEDELDIDRNGDGVPDADCSEVFAEGPDQYCGNTEQSAPARWAPDSISLAFRTTDQLTVLDVTSPTPVAHPLAAPHCQSTCSGQFAFQPSPETP